LRFTRHPGAVELRGVVRRAGRGRRTDDVAAHRRRLGEPETGRHAVSPGRLSRRPWCVRQRRRHVHAAGDALPRETDPGR